MDKKVKILLVSALSTVVLATGVTAFALNSHADNTSTSSLTLKSADAGYNYDANSDGISKIEVVDSSGESSSSESSIASSEVVSSEISESSQENTSSEAASSESVSSAAVSTVDKDALIAAENQRHDGVIQQLTDDYNNKMAMFDQYSALSDTWQSLTAELENVNSMSSEDKASFDSQISDCKIEMDNLYYQILKIEFTDGEIPTLKLRYCSPYAVVLKYVMDQYQLDMQTENDYHSEMLNQIG